MKLSGGQLSAIQQALSSAFNYSSLRIMVRTKLGQNLENIAADDNMMVTTFELASWAEREDRVLELVQAAIEANPANKDLQHLLTKAQTWEGKPVSDGTQFAWIHVPAGSFVMGASVDRNMDSVAENSPRHELWLPAYSIASTPVTVAQFAAFVHATNYVTCAEQSASTTTSLAARLSGRVKQTWRQPLGGDFELRANHPVTNVSWYDARAYCEWAVVRLASEAEWEKAARGTDGRMYPWGNEPPNRRRCNYALHIGHTTAVDAYSEGVSPYGALDMAGNVLEWTSSLWGSNWTRPQYAYPYRPGDGRENLSEPAQTLRILRGGSFNNQANQVRCVVRFWFEPHSWYPYVGFRVAALKPA